MLDNVDVAVLTRVNDLAERHGLRPYDFVATIRYEDRPGHKPGNHILDFECPASGNGLREERFYRMLSSLGITVTDERGAVLEGHPSHIIDALDNALSLAPKPRSLF
jgi:hypothetical protein